MNEPTLSPSANARQKLIADLKLVSSDAEELLKMTADVAGQKASELRERLKRRMEVAQSDLAHLQTLAVDRAMDAGRSTDDYVHDNPWRAVGIAGGIGLMLGLLIGRR